MESTCKTVFKSRGLARALRGFNTRSSTFMPLHLVDRAHGRGRRDRVLSTDHPRWCHDRTGGVGPMMDAKSVTFALNVTCRAASAQATVDGKVCDRSECQLNCRLRAVRQRWPIRIGHRHGVLYVELRITASKLRPPGVGAAEFLERNIDGISGGQPFVGVRGLAKVVTR